MATKKNPARKPASKKPAKQAKKKKESIMDQISQMVREVREAVEQMPTKVILTTFVAGVKDNEWSPADILPVGAKLVMRREPNNPYDRNALALYHGDKKLGYMPRKDWGLSVKSYDPVWRAIADGIPIRVKVANYLPSNPSWYMIKIVCEIPDIPEAHISENMKVLSF
jgi:hypothetical protein